MKTAERDLISWLIEFGYLRYPSPEAMRKAFRVARAERGPARLARELAKHEARREVAGLRGSFGRLASPR